MEEKKLKSNKFSQTLAPKDLENIYKLVTEGRYKSRGDFVQFAVKKLLDEEIGSVEVDEEALRIIKKALKL
jgi:Arc/MetJ-type ribon-helix-helix transcriptional regulator